MKRAFRFLLAGISLVAVILTFGQGCSASGVTYSADLNGGNETPPVATSMTGHVDITFNASRTQAAYKLSVNGGVGVISSEIHFGLEDVSGPRVAILFDNPDGVDVNGTLAEGFMNDHGLIGYMESLAELETAIKEGSIYCNVHTLDNPNGAIRGQVR